MRTQQTLKNFKQYYGLLAKFPTEDKFQLSVELVEKHTNNETSDIKYVTKEEYSSICIELKERAAKNFEENNIWRKRVIKSISAFLIVFEKEEPSLDYIKAIACRACGGNVTNFNSIPKYRLQAIYNYFLKFQKIARNTQREIQLLEKDARLLKMCGIDISVRCKNIKGEA